LLGFNNLLYTEVLFTLLLCTVCYLVVRFLQREAVLYLAAVGLFLGLAALTRSVVWLFPPVLCLFLLGAWKVAFRRRLLAATVFLLAFAVTIAPWSIRNSRLEQTFVAIDTMGGRNFMMGNYEYTPEYRAWDAVRWQSGEHWTRSWRYEVNQTYPPAERDTEGKLDKLAMRQGFKYVLAHPGRTLKRDLIKFFDFWGLERELVAGASRGYFGTASTPVLLLLTAVIFGSYAFVILAGIFSMVVVPPADKRIHGFLLLLLVFICGMHTLVFGHSRYHLPLIPLILVYAAAALVHARAVWQARQHWSFWLAGGLCAILVGAWVWDITVVELERFTHMVGFGG
jgi:4-amino-4-deoxy-L-arabinose transferase-like glycosyltransferase